MTYLIQTCWSKSWERWLICQMCTLIAISIKTILWISPIMLNIRNNRRSTTFAASAKVICGLQTTSWAALDYRWTYLRTWLRFTTKKRATERAPKLGVKRSLKHSISLQQYPHRQSRQELSTCLVIWNTESFKNLWNWSGIIMRSLSVLIFKSGVLRMPRQLRKPHNFSFSRR